MGCLPLSQPAFNAVFLGCSSGLLFGLFTSRFFTLPCSGYVRNCRRVKDAANVRPRAQIFAYYQAFKLPHLFFWAFNTLASPFLFFFPALSLYSCFSQPDNSLLADGSFIFSPLLYSHNILCQKIPLTPLSGHPFL